MDDDPIPLDAPAPTPPAAAGPQGAAAPTGAPATTAPSVTPVTTPPVPTSAAGMTTPRDESREATLIDHVGGAPGLDDDATMIGARSPSRSSAPLVADAAGRTPMSALFAPAPSSTSMSSTRRVDPMLGKELGGATISGFVGEGGMGRVYLAAAGDPPRRVAVKLLSRGFGNPEAVGRFQREAAILDRLRHPGIAEIIGHGLWDDGSGGVPYMIIEFVEDAKSLVDFANEKRLDRRGRLELFHRACEAVAFAHEMLILHRDLKPANLLVDKWGRVKVIDFGVARVANGDLAMAGVRTETGQLIGTVQYMSPEQIAGDPRAVDLHTDVYALGVILYELLLDAYPYDVRGTPLHEAARIVSTAVVEPPRSLDPTIDEALERIVMRCLERDRTKRFGTAGEVAKALARYLAGPAPTTSRSTAANSSHASRAPADADVADEDALVDLDAPPGGRSAGARRAAARAGRRGNGGGASRSAQRAASVHYGSSGGARGGWWLVALVVLLASGAALLSTGTVDLRDVQRWLPGSVGGTASPAAAVAAPLASIDEISTESLMVVSAPAGATVSIDGRPEGRTPLSTMLTWTAGSPRRMVEVSAPGFDGATAVVMPDPAGRRSEPLRLVFNLAPRPSMSDATLERLLALQVEGGAVEVGIEGSSPHKLAPGRREVPLTLSRRDDAWAPTRVTFTAPGRRIEAFGQHGDDSLTVELSFGELGDQPAPVRLTPR